MAKALPIAAMNIGAAGADEFHDVVESTEWKRARLMLKRYVRGA